jgi:MOSC domain-containing protein YiiM
MLERTDSPTGTVVSLHIHGDTSGVAMIHQNELHLVAGKGIEQDRRYFDRSNHKTGRPYRRQVTLVERETIAEHAAVLGLPSIPPGVVRSNIETEGANLGNWLGHDIQIGTAVVRFYEKRTPCGQMDAICSGLRTLMKNGRQGVLAEVIQSGVVRVGDVVAVRERGNCQ